MMTTMRRLSPFFENTAERSPRGGGGRVASPAWLDAWHPLSGLTSHAVAAPASILQLARGFAAMAMRIGRPIAPRRLQGAVRRAMRGIADLSALVRDAEVRRPAGSGDADVVEARLLSSQWQSRAERAERRITELERHLASSEMTALDLRSRVVCLHGKLATSTATARYQVLTLALEGQGRPAGMELAAARGRSRS